MVPGMIVCLHKLRQAATETRRCLQKSGMDLVNHAVDHVQACLLAACASLHLSGSRPHCGSFPEQLISSVHMGWHINLLTGSASLWSDASNAVSMPAVSQPLPSANDWNAPEIAM